MQQITFVTNTTFGFSPRYAQFNGRDHLIASCTGIVEGVMNGRLCLAEEFGKFPEAWNGIPIPVNHPVRNGMYVSANDPEIIDNEVIGQFFHTRITNNNLEGEMWIDIAKCTELGGEALETLQRLENHQVVEVSTAFFHDEEMRSGTFMSVPYTSICHNIRPDHVAVLPNDIGACSVEDGCGVRANQKEGSSMCNNQDGNCQCSAAQQNEQQDEQQSEQPDTAVSPEVNMDMTAPHDGVMVALYLPQQAQEAITNALPDFPEGSAVVPANQYHITLAYLGKTDQFTAEQRLGITQAIDSFAYHTPSFAAELSGVGWFLNAEEGLDAFHLVVQSDVLYIIRNALVDFLEGWLGLEVSRAHGFVPHITLAYTPSEAEHNPPVPNINKIAFPHISLAWGDEVTQFALQGDLSIQSLSVNRILDQIPSEVAMSTNNQTEETAVEEVEELETEETTTEEADVEEAEASAEEEMAVEEEADQAHNSAEIIAKAVEGAVNAALSPYLPALQGLKANHDGQRAATVNALVANENCAFSRKQLEKLDGETLETLAKSLIPHNFSGQAPETFVNSTQEVTTIEAPSLW